MNCRIYFAAVFLLAVNCLAAAPFQIQLQEYPQKMRTFHQLSDAPVPPALRADPSALPVGQITATARATDGALWLGTTQGLMRVDFAAAERDRRQYLGGQRYLPDDYVVQLAPDERNGIWVRTKTGVAHIELKPMTLAQKTEHFEQRVRAGMIATAWSRIPRSPCPVTSQAIGRTTTTTTASGPRCMPPPNASVTP